MGCMIAFFCVNLHLFFNSSMYFKVDPDFEIIIVDKYCCKSTNQHRSGIGPAKHTLRRQSFKHYREREPWEQSQRQPLAFSCPFLITIKEALSLQRIPSFSKERSQPSSCSPSEPFSAPPVLSASSSPPSPVVHSPDVHLSVLFRTWSRMVLRGCAPNHRQAMLSLPPLAPPGSFRFGE